MKIPIDIRISMFQTCLNVSGSNYHGRRAMPAAILKYAKELYKAMQREVLLEDMPKQRTRKTKVVPSKKAQALLKRVAAKKAKK